MGDRLSCWVDPLSANGQTSKLYIFYMLNSTEQGISRLGISGTMAKSRKRKFVPSSHPGPFALVASPGKSKTKVGTLACFDFL